MRQLVISDFAMGHTTYTKINFKKLAYFSEPEMSLLKHHVNAINHHKLTTIPPPKNTTKS